MALIDHVPAAADADSLYDAFTGWTEEIGLQMYPAQEQALIEIVSGSNVIVATPTGSGKSLVATAAHFTALSQDRVSFYTAPIKALVSEKFFALCDLFGRRTSGCSPATPASTPTPRSSVPPPKCSPTSPCARAGLPTWRWS
jgi:superfamily II RNA helicase